MSRRTWLLIAVGVVAVVAAAVGGVAASGDGSSELSSRSAADLYAKEARFGTFNRAMPGEDPDQMDRSGSNLDDTVTFLGKGRYRLTVQNVGFLGYLNSFEWEAPNIVITRILASSQGSCTAVPLHNAPAAQYGSAPESSVRCLGMAIKPPKCSCLPGGAASVTFLGHPLVNGGHVYYGVAGSRLVVGDITLVPRHIPSYLITRTSSRPRTRTHRGRARR